MEKVQYFTDLHCWKKAHFLSLQIYQITDCFPDREKFGLSNQMRRASVSISSNIAEGFGRRGFGDKVRFYDFAIGSLFELQSQLYLSKDLKFVSEDKFKLCYALTEDVYRLLIAWMRKLH